MATNQQLIVLPAPPRYTGQDAGEYANQLNRWLDNLYRNVTGVTYLRGNGLYLPGLPTVGYGLVVGEVFSNGGVLTIVREGDIWVDTFAVSCKVGSVTVTV
jgi:hypothetical protein